MALRGRGGGSSPTPGCLAVLLFAGLLVRNAVSHRKVVLNHNHTARRLSVNNSAAAGTAAAAAAQQRRAAGVTTLREGRKVPGALSYELRRRALVARLTQALARNDERSALAGAPPHVKAGTTEATKAVDSGTGEFSWPTRDGHFAGDEPFPDDLGTSDDTLKDLLMDIGGGTGASVSGTGDSIVDQALLRRMRYQDKAVMMLLLLAYAGSLAFSASLAYRQATNDSPVTFYADPRFNNISVDVQDLDSFLEAFNQPPKDAQLQVTGLVPLPVLPEYWADSAIVWLGSRYRVAFSFALDLTPWLVRDDSGESEVDTAADESHREVAAGVSSEEVERLREYLEKDSNDLSYVEMRKHVTWKDWEELATNIKSQIRQGGFGGYVHVQRSPEELVTVHKNRPWANFMHSRTTKVLLALSVLGWFLYQPYMWFRHRALEVHCKYRVDLGICSYWPLISERIGPHGFCSGGNDGGLPRNLYAYATSQQSSSGSLAQLAQH